MYNSGTVPVEEENYEQDYEQVKETKSEFKSIKKQENDENLVGEEQKFSTQLCLLNSSDGYSQFTGSTIIPFPIENLLSTII